MKKVTIAVITDDGKLLVFNKPIDDLKAMNHGKVLYGVHDGATIEEMVGDYVDKTFGYLCNSQIIKTMSIVLD